MRPFGYSRAESPASAIEGARAKGAAFIAGGTSLVDLMRLGVEAPETLVDINDLDFASVDETPGGGLSIGALVRNSDLAEHPSVVDRFPALSAALLSGASPQLRNMATVGGNILQRTRCPYFRNAFAACNKRSPRSGCGAFDGQNRTHAILGGSEHCIAVHPSDLCVALVALDATVHLRGRGAERTVPFEAFHLLPADHPERETVLLPGELITRVTLPGVPFFARSRYVKVRDRASFDFALASAAAALDVENGKIRSARLALGGVATKPWRCHEAELALTGQPPTRESYEWAAEVALRAAKPRQHNAFKTKLAARVIVRVLEASGAAT